MSGWSAAKISSIVAIQAFWLVALAAAERIATSPASPICSAIMSTWTWAMPSAVAWLMNRSRQVGVDVGVEGDDLGAGVAGRVERVAQRLRVVARDDERVHALLGGGVDERHLGVRADGVGTDLGVGAAELVDGLLAAGVAGVEVGVAESLGRKVTVVASPPPPPPPPPSSAVEESSDPHPARPRLATSASTAPAAYRLDLIFIEVPFVIPDGCWPSCAGEAPGPATGSWRRSPRPRAGGR